MSAPPSVVDWCEANGYGEITAIEPAAGGCIHRATRLRTRSGATFFLKTNASVPADMFAREAEGLLALVVDGAPRLPRPHLWEASFLLLEDLDPRPAAPDYWERLGRQLARLHDHTAERFGFAADNYIGLTPQPNPWTTDGFAFFADHRLGFQVRLARGAGRLSADDADQIEDVAARLESLVPEQPPSLLHGDLWSGNVIPDQAGRACLIDPACHYGWAEAEIGMTMLFGGFPASFYRAYLEARPLPPGWEERLPVYNLYHLLNHLNLFGTSYLGSIRSILRQFA